MNSSELKGFLTGLIIGDGFIDKGITKRQFKIKSINYSFIKYIYDQLTSCTNFDISIKYNPSGYRCGCNHNEYWELIIKSHPYFAKKYHHFYDDYRNRIISSDAMEWLTPAGIANWYMSDGYVCLVGKTKGHIYNRRVDICTDRYDIDTIKRLTKMLKDKYSINSSIIKRGQFHRIRIKVDSYTKFFSLISPYVVDGMEHKMYLGYDYQPKWMPDEMWSEQEYLRSATTQTAKAVG